MELIAVALARLVAFLEIQALDPRQIFVREMPVALVCRYWQSSRWVDRAMLHGSLEPVVGI